MPLYSDNILEEVRSSVNLVSVVSEYVPLKKRGRNWVARCPFHNERTPSFNVSEEKQIFMCFGCGVGGDVFKFVSTVEHLSFPEAVRFVAERSGIALPRPDAPAPVAGDSDPDTLRACMKDASAFFVRMMRETQEGKTASQYLQERGVALATTEAFGLGYSPGEGTALVRELTGRLGYTQRHLIDCGLAKLADDGVRVYDAFRRRVMFPILNVRGQVIAFGGRALGEAQPKYLNSPETRLYNKSSNLYGLSFARDAIKQAGFAILVEGYMDFIVPFQHGVGNVVASLGTSLTPQQVRLLGRYTREVAVNYDPDSAGIAATRRSLELFLEEDFRVKVVSLPAGKDPDRYVRDEGVGAYHARVEQSLPCLDFVLETALRKQGGMDSARKKVQVLNEVLPYLAKVPSAIERSEYVFQVARRLAIDDKLMLTELRRAAQQRKAGISPGTGAPSDHVKLAEKRLLQLLLGDRSLQDRILPDCSADDFAGLAAEKIFAELRERHRKGEKTTFESMADAFRGKEEESLLARLRMEDCPEGLTRETAESCLDALRELRLESYRRQIQSKIAEAESRRDDEMLDLLYAQRIQVDRDLMQLSRK